MIASRHRAFPATRNHASPSPDPLHDDAMVNDTLLRAARTSTNPYLRAGVLAVAANHPIASRRSTSGGPASSAVLEGDDWVVPLPSRSRSNASAQQRHGQTSARSNSSSHHRMEEAPQRVVRLAAASSSSGSHQVDARAARRGTPRQPHSQRHAVQPSPVLLTDDEVVDAWEYNEAGSNVLLSEGTVLEHTSEERRHRRHDAAEKDALWLPDDESDSASHATGSVRTSYAAGQKDLSRPSGAADVEEAHGGPTNMEALFVTMMSNFNRQFGSMRPLVSYIPALDQYLHLSGVKTPEATALETAVRDSARNGRGNGPTTERVVAAAPVITLAASPDRRQTNTAHQLAQAGGPNPPYDVAEHLMHQTFACGLCGAKRMRGLQCSRCGGALPQIRVCDSCQSWTRGNFCSTCGAPNSTTH